MKAIQKIILSFILFFLFSCEKWIEVDTPKTDLPSSLVFASKESVTSAISGLYSRVMQSNLQMLSGGLTLYAGMTADEIINTTPGLNDQFSKNNLTAANASISSLWLGSYNYIYQANTIMEGLDLNTTLDKQFKNQIYGEALFIRSLCYFYLVNLFENIPLVTKSDYRISGAIGTEKPSVIYNKIIEDLKTSILFLNESYPTSEKIRSNKYAAMALLARAYLYTNQYALAIENSSAIINSKKYSLNKIADVFLSNSSEAILQFLPVSANNNTWEASLFLPSSSTAIPIYAMRTSLYDSFDLKDQRKTTWIGQSKINGINYQYSYKYKIRTGTVKTEYYIVFRLAEQYLILAEAHSKLNNISLAVENLNVIRERAGLANILTTVDKIALDKLIEEERRHEFFFEWGHRWFDLKRTNRINEVLIREKGFDWQSEDALFPIPLNEINKNPLLIQNKNY